LAWVRNGGPEGFQVVINPSIVEQTGFNVSGLEGCLSFPGRQTYVPRNSIIRATWVDEKEVSHDEWIIGRMGADSTT